MITVIRAMSKSFLLLLLWYWPDKSSKSDHYSWNLFGHCYLHNRNNFGWFWWQRSAFCNHHLTNNSLFDGIAWPLHKILCNTMFECYHKIGYVCFIDCTWYKVLQKHQEIFKWFLFTPVSMWFVFQNIQIQFYILHF